MGFLKRLFFGKRADIREEEPLDFGLIDGHVHIASGRYLPPAFTDPIVDNIYVGTRAFMPGVKRETLAGVFSRKLGDHDCDGLVAEMDRAGIERAVLMLPDFTYALKGLDMDIRGMLDAHVAVQDRHKDRFYLFAGVDPRWGGEGVAIFRDYLDRGKIHGLKVYPPCGYYPGDDGLNPYYDMCQEHHLPVLLHTGPTSPLFQAKYSALRHIDELAHKYPGVDFILGHGGVTGVEDAALLCSFRPNVYMDISGYFFSLSPLGPMGALRDLFKRKLNHKIIFGTDWPIGGFKSTYSGVVGKLVHPERGGLVGLSAPEKRRVLRDNLLGLLKRP